MLQVVSETLSMLLLMKTLRFTTLPGDGIGPEVMDVALNVLQKLGNLHDFSIESSNHDVPKAPRLEHPFNEHAV